MTSVPRQESILNLAMLKKLEAEITCDLEEQGGMLG